MKLWDIVRETAAAWNKHNAPRMAAALAYYTLFSIAPLLVLAVAIASVVFGEKAARGELSAQLENTVGTAAASAVEELLTHTRAGAESTWATVLSIALLLFGASGVFVEMQDALNTIWNVRAKPGRGLYNVVRDRLLSFLVVLSAGFLLLVMVIVSTALSAISSFLTPDVLPGSVHLWQVLNAAVSFVFVAVLFALVFKLLPDVILAWRDVWIGAVVTALLFTLGKYLIALYLGYGSTTSAFGAAGSLVLVLLWLYYSFLILLFGAEFTRSLALRCGTRIDCARHAEFVTDRTRES
ncbi:MAG: YihY/virulence factor BrkB family protein [Gemmataceae bacterium]|nr:YihY/virulence factor BrkB family protein [Gemmataceae bacterium]